jgi:transcriptional regulator with XRE-family HTH domain
MSSTFRTRKLAPPRLGKNIKQIRKLCGVIVGHKDAQGEPDEITQREFGARGGSESFPLKQSTVAGWEKRRRMPDGATLRSIQLLCDVTEHQLLHEEIVRLGERNFVFDVWLDRKLGEIKQKNPDVRVA